MYKKYFIFFIIILVYINNVGCGSKAQPEVDLDINSSIKMTTPTVTTTVMSTVTPIPTSTKYSNFNMELINWLNNTTNIPIYLPNKWEPIMKETKSQNYYYFESLGDKDSYNLNVYTTKAFVKFNDNNDLLVKNGPVSESDYIGSISGAKNGASETPFEIPKDAKKFELIQGVVAYEKDDGISVWWKEKGWKFSFIGTSDYLEDLKALASAFYDSDIKISKIGNVKIEANNKLATSFVWEKDGYQYIFKSQNNNFKEIINILNSFVKI